MIGRMSDPSPTDRHVVYVPLDDVRPADRNPKRHDHATLAASVRRFGFVEPMVRDERTGRLVAGHGRLDELRMARARAPQSPPDGVRIEAGAWLVPVLAGWSSRNDSEAEAYLVASNRTVEAGGWDETVLTDLLSDLEPLGPDAFEGIGYSLDDALAMLSKRLGEETEPDDAGRPQLDGLRYRVVIDADDETHQAELIDELSARGLAVRAVVN